MAAGPDFQPHAGRAASASAHKKPPFFGLVGLLEQLANCMSFRASQFRSLSAFRTQNNRRWDALSCRSAAEIRAAR
jgi:hypothetical protein